MLAERCVSELKDALKSFGEYSYSDKGPHEVMNFSQILRDFRSLSEDECVSELQGILDCRLPRVKAEHREFLVRCIVSELQDWEALWVKHDGFLQKFL